MFYLGYSPIMPGTIGSIGGVILYLLVHTNLFIYFAITIILFLLGLLISHPAERIFNERDSGKIVIDEAGGMLLTYMFVPFSIYSLLIGFLLFRFFDILKPPPLKWLQNLPKGFGVMMDDFGAAIYSNLILRILCEHSLR